MGSHVLKLSFVELARRWVSLILEDGGRYPHVPP